MNLFQYVVRGLWQRRLSSILLMFSVALGVMLVAVVLLMQEELDETYARQTAGYSLVVGPAGSGLELVLNSVYHVGSSRGLVPYATLRELESEAFAPYVKAAIPYAVGDSFRGFPVIATSDAVFEPVFPQPRGNAAEKLAEGRGFRYSRHAVDDAIREMGAVESADDHAHDHDHEHELVREAVLGAEVAERLDLAIGDMIEPSHGVEGHTAHAHHQEWEVVGILAETNTPIDRVVFINLDSFYRIEDHVGGKMPVTGDAGLSAILLFPRKGYAKGVLLQNLRKRNDLLVADVAVEIDRLLEIVGNVDILFLVIAWLVVIVAVVSIMVATYNTMSERRREIAILRAIGAPRRSVFGAVVAESAMLALTGAVVGIVMGHALAALASTRIESIANVRLDAWTFLPVELLVVGVVTLAGALAGVWPAYLAYRVDVGRHLAPLS